MHFKFTGGEPIYIQIASQLEEAIFTGVFQKESRYHRLRKFHETFILILQRF